MLNLRPVEGCCSCRAAGGLSLLSAAPSLVAQPGSHHHRRNVAFGRGVMFSRLPCTDGEISSRGLHPLNKICVGVSPCSAYVEPGLVAKTDSLGNEHMKARIRKQLQQGTISPCAYDTAWVSMVPLPGNPHAPCFPQCIEWILQNQEDNGSWGMEKVGSSANKDILLSTLACLIALKKWKMGEENIRRGLHFIGRNFSIVMDKQIAAPVGFSLIFSGMLSLATGMGLEFPASQRSDIDRMILHWEEELERISMEKSFGTKAYIAFVSEGLGNLVDWSEVMKFQRKNGSLFNSPSATAAMLVHKYDDKALHFLSSFVGKFSSADPTVYPLNIRCKLSMVDSLEKIGISHHFSSEIKSILDMTYSLWLQRVDEIMLDFATCSIAFRLLRLNGYGVSSDDMFHMAEVSSFYNSFQGYINDQKSLLELYKAAKVSISENEFILDSIGNWSGSLLMELQLDELQRIPIWREIEHALKFPFYSTLERLDHRRNIENFDTTDSEMVKTKYMPCGVNGDLLSLAVEEFTLSQSIYQEELIHLDCWVKENRLDQLQFARQKATYSYLLAAGSITPHEMSDARISIAKSIVLATVIDDFFDGEGSNEELKDLITLVEKWDEHYNSKLYTEKVKIIFLSLYTSIKELGSMVSAVQNCDVTEHFIETWLHVLRSMFLEAEWRMNKYVPTIEEYTENAIISIASGPVVLPTMYFVGHKLSKWIVKDQEYNELLRLTSICARLLNDIQGVEREGSEGKLNSVSLLVNHSGGSISIDMAKKVIRKSIIATTRDLLRLVLREERFIPMPCKEVFWKICKTPHFLYYESDGFTSPENMISAVNELIYEPLKIPASSSSPS